LVGGVTYYAENYNIQTGCSSNERTAVTLTLFDCSVSLIKEADLIDNNGCSDPGDKVLFTYTVGNPGNIELTNINIEDPLLQNPNPQVSINYLSGDDNNDGILGLNELWVYTAEYSITQDNLDDGVISSTASVQAETYFNETASDLSHDVSFFEDGPTSISICQEGRIGIIMEGTWNDLDGDFTADVGETITYTFSIKNFSGTQVSEINVSSQNPEVEITGNTSLELGADQEDFTTYSATYTLKQEDINRLFFDAQVTVTALLGGVELTDNSDPVSYDEDAPTRVILPSVGSQADEIAIYNGVTPNNDGKNDFFWIENIDAYPGNDMKIYNRWGVLVWESRGYDETNNVFRGYANVGSASGSGNLLPTGTYFYVLSFDANSQPINGQSAYTGYLYLNQ
jgi:gliding motility-associated-like protein/uncharacterized repeat protein (TIGR01451 family)